MALIHETPPIDDIHEHGPESIIGALLGRIVALDPRGRAFVEHPKNPTTQALVAVSNLQLGPEDVGAPVTLLFEHGDPLRPIIIGRIWRSPDLPSPQKIALTVDDERLELNGEREIVLRCGKASITLTRAGKILLRGTYILQTSSGATKIKGATVHIN